MVAVKKAKVNRTACVLVAEVAAEAERYQDVVSEIKKIITAYSELTSEERSLLSVAYKNLTNILRNSWRSMDALEAATVAHSSPNSPKRRRELRLIREEKRKIENELVVTCNDIITLLDKHLLQTARPGEEAVFYAKMKGDYYRYLAEFGPTQEQPRFGDLSHQAYKQAYHRALGSLEPLDPTRLGLALNFSVFYHDVYKSPDRACHLAKSAFDDAVQCLEPGRSTIDQALRDALSILQLLRDDLLLWSQEL